MQMCPYFICGYLLIFSFLFLNLSFISALH
uniref:Uncharacterized protein n=1 Tax=Rhizophora mucronata TaxID=61149 RepID=A0A2P2N845_RHIMU